MVICEVLVKKDDNLKEMCRVGWEQQVCPTPPTPVETARLIFPGQPTTNLSDPRFSHMLPGFSQQLQEDWGKGILRYFLQQWYLEVWICFIFVSKSRTEIVSELNSIFHISGVAKFCRLKFGRTDLSDICGSTITPESYEISLPRCRWLSTHPPSTQMSRLGMTSWSQRRRDGSCVNKMEKVCSKSSKSNKGVQL